MYNEFDPKHYKGKWPCTTKTLYNKKHWLVDFINIFFYKYFYIISSTHKIKYIVLWNQSKYFYQQNLLWQHLFHTSTPIITRWYFISFFKYSVKCSLTFKSTIQTNVCNRITRIFQTMACIVQPCIVKILIKVSMECLGKESG